MTLGATALLALVVFGAFTVEAAIGFGSTVVAVSLGSLLVPVHELLPAYVPVNLVLSAILTARNARAIDRRRLFVAILPAMLVGLPAGLFLFHTASDRSLQVAFGLLVVVLSALELGATRRSPSAPRPLPRGAGAALLVGAGVVHGAFSTGGPLVVYVLGRAGLDKTAFRATLSALWLVLGAILVTSYALSGSLTATTGRTSALLLPPLVIGLALGERLHRRVSPATFQRLVFALLLVAGAALAVRNS